MAEHAQYNNKHGAQLTNELALQILFALSRRALCLLFKEQKLSYSYLINLPQTINHQQVVLGLFEFFKNC